MTARDAITKIGEIVPGAVALLITAALLYGMYYSSKRFFGNDVQTPNDSVAPDITTKLAEWCAGFSSYDDSKSLEFHYMDKDDQSTFEATMKAAPEKERGKSIFEIDDPVISKGTWSVHENTRSTLVTFGGATTAYRFFNPAGICILSPGNDEKTINIQNSWFTTEENPLENTDPDPNP